ncbi:MAG: ATP synthase F1 subunit epsilon [Myxococcales bacterium]|nr:ATP synthase F1 subunit epsilon [Myxococcales bacterium]
MSLKVEIITPEAIAYASGDSPIEEVVLPGLNGELGILEGHLPLMTTLRSGRVVIRHKDGKATRFAIHGGFAQIMPAEVNILTDEAESADAIDPDRARAALEAAEKKLQEEMGRDHVEDDAAKLHRAALDRARARLFVAEEDKNS